MPIEMPALFQWTPGVRGLSVVLSRAIAYHLKGVKSYLPLLEGERGSLAASLNYALANSPHGCLTCLVPIIWEMRVLKGIGAT